jgi:hypothetical protein
MNDIARNQTLMMKKITIWKGHNNKPLIPLLRDNLKILAKDGNLVMNKKFPTILPPQTL